jgi:hypothetical protein
MVGLYFVPPPNSKKSQPHESFSILNHKKFLYTVVELLGFLKTSSMEEERNEIY